MAPRSRRSRLTLDWVTVRPRAVSGVLSASALAATEAEQVTGVPVLTKAALESRRIARLLGL